MRASRTGVPRRFLEKDGFANWPPSSFRIAPLGQIALPVGYSFTFGETPLSAERSKTATISDVTDFWKASDLSYSISITKTKLWDSCLPICHWRKDGSIRQRRTAHRRTAIESVQDVATARMDSDLKSTSTWKPTNSSEGPVSPNAGSVGRFTGCRIEREVKNSV
jgi:hypothetical protein